LLPVNDPSRMKSILSKYPIQILVGLYLLTGIVTIAYCDGTGDSGDSVLHYLFAKFAFTHPKLFFDHWAKPLFVLLSAPFAHFGFTGMKIFNLLVSTLSLVLTYKSIQALNLRNAILGPVLVVVAPLNFILTFSGLTEPLFALALIGSLYCILRKQLILASVIVSFIPFIRSEGLLFIGLFGIFFLLRRNWIPLIFLAAGHLFFACAGYSVHHDFLWVIRKIPYASMSSPYGNGELLHFFHQLYYVIGLPMTILFWTGFIFMVVQLIRRKQNLMKEENFIVLLGFVVYFIFHSLAWKWGLFNSMGLKRVLIGVIPFIAIISLYGFTSLTENSFIRKKPGQVMKLILVTYLLLFPVIPNPASINWKKDMMLGPDQMLSNRVATMMHYAGKRRYIFSHPYLSEALHLDHFDPTARLELNRNTLKQLKSRDIIIWENWFSVVEDGITREYLEKDNRLVKIREFNNKDNDSASTFVVFEVR
jgi:hypothetical protein